MAMVGVDISSIQTALQPKSVRFISVLALNSHLAKAKQVCKCFFYFFYLSVLYMYLKRKESRSASPNSSKTYRSYSNLQTAVNSYTL